MISYYTNALTIKNGEMFTFTSRPIIMSDFLALVILEWIHTSYTHQSSIYIDNAIDKQLLLDIHLYLLPVDT
jgi:hypothetical protein